MENINISLGIELDKKQFNDKYIQGEVDKAASDLTVKVNSVKIGDVSKSLQNDLSKQAGKLNVQIKDVNINESEVKATVDRIAKSIQDSLDAIPEEQRIKLVAEGGIFDLKAIQRELTSGVKNAINEGVQDVGIDFGKVSVTGGKKVATELIDILESEIPNSGYKESIVEVNSELDKLDNRSVDVDINLGYKESTEDTLKSITNDFKNISTEIDMFGIPGDKEFEEYETRINRIFDRIDDLESLGLNIDNNQLENLYMDIDKLRDKMTGLLADSLSKSSGDSFSWLSGELEEANQKIQSLEHNISRLDISSGNFDAEDIVNYQNKIESLKSSINFLRYEDEFNEFGNNIDGAILRLNELKESLDFKQQSLTNIDFKNTSDEILNIKNDIDELYKEIDIGDFNIENLTYMNKEFEDIQNKFNSIIDSSQKGYAQLKVLVDKLSYDMEEINIQEDWVDLKQIYELEDVLNKISIISSGLKFDSSKLMPGEDLEECNKNLSLYKRLLEEAKQMANNFDFDNPYDNDGNLKKAYDDVRKLESALSSFETKLVNISKRGIEVSDSLSEIGKAANNYGGYEQKINSGDNLKLEVSDVAIVNEDQIKSSLQQSLNSISESLSILIEKVYLYHESSRLVNDVNNDISILSDKLNPIEAKIAIPDEFKANILSDLENLFNNIQPVFERLQNEFKVTASKLEEYFKPVMDNIARDLKYLLSENISFDFNSAKLVGFYDKLNEIRNKLALKVDNIEIEYSEFQQNDIQAQLNAFTEDVELQIGKIKLLNIANEIQAKLDDVGKDLEITVKTVNVNGEKSKISNDIEKQSSTIDSNEISKVISPKEARSMIAKLNKEYNDSINSLLTDFINMGSLKGIKGKLEAAIKSNSFDSDELLSGVVDTALKNLHKSAKSQADNYKKEILKGYNSIREHLKGVVFNENMLKDILDKDELDYFKKSISGIAETSKSAGVSIDSFMQELKGIAQINGVDLGGDVIQDNIEKLSAYILEMKRLKKEKVVGEFTDVEEDQHIAKVVKRYYELIDVIKEVKSARDSGIASVEKQLEESKKLSEQQKQVENVASGIKEVGESTNKATAEMKEYNDELDKAVKTSATFVDNDKKEISKTTENLGQTRTATIKFNVDETTTEIDKIVNNTKAFNKEIDVVRKKIESLKNIDADVITKITNELNEFKIGDSIDKFERFKKEVEELSNLDEKIKNANESISNLNKELKESKIDGYIDKAVFKDIQNSINNITTDTAEEEIKALSDRIKELKVIKNDIVNVDKAIKDLTRDLTTMSGSTGNNGLGFLENIDDAVKLHSELQDLNEIKNRLEGGEFIGADVQKRIASVTSSMKDLKAAISQTSKELTQTEKSNKQLETLSIKQEELSKRLKQLFADGYIDTNQFEKLEDKINDLDVEHLAKGIFDIKSEFDRLVTSASSIDRVAKNISELERSIDKVAAKKLNVVDSNDAVKELNNVLSKIKELESLRDKINSGEDVGATKINKVYVNARNAVQDYKDVLTELSNNAKKTESQLNKVSNTIEELNYKIAKAEGKNSDIADFSVVINALSKYEEKLKELDDIQSKVINGEDVSDNVIERAITNAKRETDNYIETLKLANTHGTKFEETFNRLSKVSTDRVALGLDTEIINKFNSELFNLPQGADASNKKFTEINNSLSIMEDNIKKISSLKNVLKDIESNISDLTTKKNDGIISDSEARKLEEIKGIVANLTKTIQDLSNNAEIGSVKFEQLSTAAKNSIKNVEGLGDAQARLGSKLREMQVEEIVDSEQFDNLQRRINNISAKKLKSEVNSIEKEFEDLIKNSKQIDTISKAIDKATESIEQANADNFEIINSEKAIDEIESLMNVFSNKLTDLYELQNKISQGELIGNKAINRAIEGINKIADTYKDTLSSLSSNTNMFNEISKKLETSLSDKAILGLDDSYVRGLIEELNKIDLSSNEAEASLNKLNDTVKNLGKSDKDIQKLQGVIKQLEDTISRINDRKNLGIVTESDLRKMEEMKSHVSELNGVIDKLNNGIEITQIEIKDLETAAKNSMKNISTVAESTRNSFANLGVSLNRAMEFAIGDTIGDMISSQFRMAKDTILEIDNSLRDLRRVTKLTEEGYENFTKSANETAMALGRTTVETINATTEFVKLGYSVEQAEGFLSKAGLTLANVADMETGDAIAAITSTLKGFGIEVEQVTRVVDVMNEAGNKYALNSSDLAEMLRIASASMSIAGNDLEQTSALMIGAFEILRDSSKVANGLKTISMRLRGVAEEGEELNPKLGELIKTLTGVDLTDANGEFRNTYDILTEIGEQFDGLNSKEQALLLEEIAGKNQANVLASLIQNLEKIPKAYETLKDAAGSAAREQEAYVNSLSGKLNQLKENIAGIWIDLVDRGAVGEAIDSLNSVISAFRGLSDTFGSLPTLVGVGTLAFTTFSAKGREMASTLRENVVGGLSLMSNTVDGVVTKISGFKGRLEEKIRTLKTDIATTKESITTNRANGESIDGLRGKLVNLTVKQGVATAGMIAMKAATIALQSAMTMGLSIAVTFLIDGLTKLIDKAVTTKSELKELNAEFRNDETVTSVANTNKLISSYEELSNKLKTVTEGSSEYRDIKNELSEVEKQLLELYPKAKAGIDAETGATKLNIEAVKELTDEQYNLAKAKALANLKDNKLTGLESANKIRQELNDLKDYQIKLEAIADIAEKGMRSTTVELSSGKSVKVYADDLEKITKKYEEQKEKVETLAIDTQILGRENEKYAAVAKEITKVLDEMNGVAKESIDTSGVNAGTEALELMGNAAEETKSSIDDLGDAFNNLKSPLDLLNTMMKEFSEYGGLTDETYSKVLTSENLDLIALLANSENFMQSAEELRQKYLSGLDETAKSIIAFAVGSSDAMQDGAKVIDSSNQRIIDSLNERLNTIQDISEEERNLIESQIDAIEKLALVDVGGEGYSQLMYNLMESMNLAGDKARELEVLMTQSIVDYVNNGGQLYAQDAQNKEAFDEAKANSSEIWASNELSILANQILAKEGQYSQDVVNWANAIANKTYDSATFTDEVLIQIANMVLLSAENYSQDTVNWAMAITNKNQNHVNMINNILKNVAKMVLASAENYSQDTVNWANAIINKDKNNADLCNSITNNMAGVVNTLAQQYASDDTNFRNLMLSKKNYLNAFNSWYKQNGGTDKSYDRMSIAQAEALEKQFQKETGIQLGGQGELNLGGGFKPVSVSGGNYVGNVGSAADLKDNDKESSKKDVDDLKDVVDRYYSLNNALQKIENEISAIDTELDSKTGKDRIALIEKEIKLLDDKRTALINIRNEQNRELSELRSALSGKGFSFAADGQIANYHSQLNNLVASANSQTGEAKEQAIANVKDVISQIEKYTDLLLSDIPDITNQINSITGSVSDLREEIEQIIEDTTFFTKDFIDRYYELNNALKQVENQLNAISVAIKNADDNKMIELLDKQIELYIKQGEALAAIRKENVAELNELGKELYDAGFRFNDDGTLSNYQSLIDKMVQDANKITDGKKQEKAIERIEELIETIEKYTDMLLNDIPDITNDMDDLANSVIASQEEIADILSKQKDEYIENLKEETEALKKEIERRKDILQKQWDKEDAEDELAEKQKKLNELEDKLTIALRTGDEELIKNIREQIAEAQKEINDFIRDEERDYISDRFDEDLDKLDEDLNNKIDEINEKLSDEELLNLVQSGVRDLTEVLNEIENGSKGVRNAFAAIGTTISETWINALDTFVDKLNSISDINLGFNVGSKLAKFKEGFNRSFNITQGNLIVQGNITEDVLPIVQNMIDVANNNLINDINAAFSR